MLLALLFLFFIVEFLSGSSFEQVGLCTTHNSHGNGLGVELRSADSHFTLSGGVGFGLIFKVNLGGGVAHNISRHRPDVDLRVRLGHFNLEFKTERAVTFNLKFFRVAGAQSHVSAKVNEFGE